MPNRKNGVIKLRLPFSRERRSTCYAGYRAEGSNRQRCNEIFNAVHRFRFYSHIAELVTVSNFCK